MRVCCIIKPEALGHAEDIRTMFESAGFLIIMERQLRYTSGLIHCLYDHMALATREAIASRLDEQLGYALAVETPDVESVLELAGRVSDPRACAPHTIRYQFGCHDEPERMGEDPWWTNAIHRPTTHDEARRDMALVFPGV